MLSKKVYCGVLVVAISLLSCKKTTVVNVDNGCISRITRDYSEPDKVKLAAGANLLMNNQIPATNLVILHVILDDTIKTNGPLHVLQHVVAQQYANGIPILFAQVAYHFNSNVYTSTDGYLYGKIALNETPHTSIATLRYLYLDAAKKDRYSVINHISDSCLVAEFVYFDTNTSTHNHIIKAWRVTPSNSNYPEAIIADDNSSLISYFNGIINL